MRAVRVAIVVLLVLGVAPSAWAAPRRTGVLIVDHGEPPEYNELTYWSFRKFFNHLIEMGVVPKWIKSLDQGTVLQDEDCYGCEGPNPEADLMDAWLHHHEGPAGFVPESDSLPAYYFIPSGPGVGEPDIFEHVGLSAWNEWELMGGRSPNFAEKLPKKRAVIQRLRTRYGRDLPVRIGYGIDPRIKGGRQDIRSAVVGLVNRDRVDRVVVAYHGVGFSDIMQTHMIRHEIEGILEEVGPDVSVSYAKPIGTRAAYVRAVVRKARTELKQVPEHAPVALHLSGHGLQTGMCGEYDCGADSYHRFAKRLFRRTRRAILSSVDRHGDFDVFHVYGDGGTEEGDPGDEVDSPIEALDARKMRGYRYVIDIPYEFDSNSRDTLIVLRQGYERPIPDWNHRFESRFRYKGMTVKITDCSYGSARKIDAFESVIADAVERHRDDHPHDPHAH